MNFCFEESKKEYDIHKVIVIQKIIRGFFARKLYFKKLSQRILKVCMNRKKKN